MIASMTPRTVWRTSPSKPADWEELFEQIAIFGESPLIVKDYVKSRKHEWDDVTYDEDQPDLTPFMEIARTITSRFFTMDIAKTAEGSWIIVELGDGGVSGLPEQMDVSAFYEGFIQ
jgi:hypothetical protein